MNFTQDLRFALRSFVTNPGLSTVIVVTLALGIGANTTVFTLVNAVLFRGLPFEQADRIMFVSGRDPARPDNRPGLSYPDFRDLRAQAKAFQDLAAFSYATFNVSDVTSTPERYQGARMSANSFSMIGQKIAIGRDFMKDEDKPGAIPVAIIGHGLWKNRYGADPKVLGKSIRVNEVAATIIGVLPEGVKFPSNAEMWMPLVPDARMEKRDARSLSVFGRLADGFDVAQARAEAGAIAERFAKDYPASHKGRGIRIDPYNDVFNGGPIRIVFLALLGAVGFVLLIACANVANLLLSRSNVRKREMSVRTALGASRWRIIRQLLTESVLLGTIGGALGLAIATQGVRMFDLAVADVGKPYWIVFEFDYTVFAYLAAICLGTGILFGIFPAIHTSRVDLNTTLKEGGRGTAGSTRGWLSGALVVVELALSVVLLAGAGLMIRSIFSFYGMHSGIDATRMMTMRYVLPEAKYPKEDSRIRFTTEVEPRVRAVPGLAGGGLASHSPNGGSFSWFYQVEGQPPVEREKRPATAGLVITPSYFDAIGIPLVSGRAFTDADGTTGKEAVIVNQRFAMKHWPNQNPIGKRVRILRDDREQPWLTVIAISRDIRQNSPNEKEIEPVLYVPYKQDPATSMVILARTNVEAVSVSSALRKAVQAVDSDLPVFDVRTLEQSIQRQRWTVTVFGTLFAIFAVIALLLSAVGIFGVIAYSVSQRTQEIGVRVALGAAAKDILLLIMSRGVLQLALGITIGLAGAYGLTRVIATLLVQVSPTDPLTFGVVTILLLATGLLACLLPARRALKVHPMTALRYE